MARAGRDDRPEPKRAIPGRETLSRAALWVTGLPLVRMLRGSLADLTPVICVVAFFQIAVLQQPIPDLGRILAGAGCVILGLALFIRGLETSLFPLGEQMAEALVRKGSFPWLLGFAFLLGFGTTVAEPSLIAVAAEAARVAADGNVIAADAGTLSRYALGLRVTVAIAVGTALIVGVLRIVFGWPLHWVIICGYLAVVLLTFLAPPEIIGIAYDSGGVTTSTVTVPLVAALGIGLARTIQGRDPLSDGFGLIAMASLMPMVFVMLYGMAVRAGLWT